MNTKNNPFWLIAQVVIIGGLIVSTVLLALSAAGIANTSECLTLFGCFLAAFIVVCIFTFNRLRALRESVHERCGNLAAAIKKRSSMVSQLVDVAREFGAHEKSIQLSVSDSVAGTAQLLQTQALADQAYNHIVAVARNFPQLKADSTYQQLQQQIQAADEAIDQRRVAYNESVREYNVARTQIPTVVFGKLFQMRPADYFSHEKAAEYDFA